jgi:hypothetical protein
METDFYNPSRAQCWAIECFRMAYIQEHNDTEGRHNTLSIQQVEDRFIEFIKRSFKERLCAVIGCEENNQLVGFSFRESLWKSHTTDFNINEFINANVVECCPEEEGCGITLKELLDRFQDSPFSCGGGGTVSYRKGFIRAVAKIIGMPVRIHPAGLMFANRKFVTQ